MTAPRIVVITQRWLKIDASNKDAAYGLILRNRSKQDALHVAVRVTGFDAHGRRLVTDEQSMTVIPAGGKFVVGGSLIWETSVNVRRIKVRVHVGHLAAPGRRLPSVLRTSLVSRTLGIDAKVTWRNSLERSLPPTAMVYVAFLDARGHIVDAGGLETQATIGPEERSSIEVGGDLSEVTPEPTAASIHSILATVDPCGEAAGSPSCPVAGAR